MIGHQKGIEVTAIAIATTTARFALWGQTYVGTTDLTLSLSLRLNPKLRSFRLSPYVMVNSYSCLGGISTRA